MSKAEVKAAQPNPIINISDACTGYLAYSYESKKLKTVTMEAGAKTSPDCEDLVRRSLFAKYGAPSATKTLRERGECGNGQLGKLCRAMGGEKVVTSAFAQWRKDGTRVLLTTTDADSEWKVEYNADLSVTSDTVSKF